MGVNRPGGKFRGQKCNYQTPSILCLRSGLLVPEEAHYLLSQSRQGRLKFILLQVLTTPPGSGG